MTQMTETLLSTSFRETEVQHYDCLPRPSGERQLPEELQIRLFVAPGGMVEATQVSYHYDVEDPVLRRKRSGNQEAPFIHEHR